MNKLLFLLLIVLFCSCFGVFREGLQSKGVYGTRQYFPIPHANVGPFLRPENAMSKKEYAGHNAQLGF